LNVWLAIPSYTGQIHIATMRSLLKDYVSFKDRGDSVTVYDECGSALIADARAEIVAKFLASDADTLIFIDNDVAWEAGAALRLADHPVDFVSGIYPMRKDPIEYPISWDQTKAELWADPDTGLLEVDAVPAGFMKMSRNMLEKMVTNYRCELEHYSKNAPDDTAWALFDPYWEGDKKFGEDYSFCKRWREMGEKVWIDPDIDMAHVGLKTFVGNLADYLRGR